MSIVFSQALLTAPGGLDLNAGVIGWQNFVTYESVTADSSSSLFPVTNLANPDTTLRWLSLITTVQYITVDVSPEDLIDYVGIARHNLGSGAIKVSVEAFISGVWVEQYPQFTPTKDSPLVMRFLPVSADNVRIKLEPTAGVAPTIAALYVGKLLQLQRRIYVGHTPLPYGRETDYTNNVSETGDFQGRIELKKRLETSVQLQNLTPNWYRDSLDPFLRYVDEGGGRSLPFFFAWRPLTYPLEVGYAWLTNNPKPVNQRSNGMMSINLSMAGLV